ncbi:LuxR C-terminal-related transcriptional regulator [Nocardiopsis dassonvillei]|uniref:LuxR C-terminal-related transcriptional regulator n=1 Tax=Nocardiopsis dassonvillei TaxID=2014 RepID=UPI0036340449
MRILLAEDAALLREGVCALLERAGHTVIAVSTATELDQQARSLAAQDSIDLILTDVRMPPGGTDDGLRVAVGLRAAYPDLPIVILSQYITHDYAAALLGEDGTSGTTSVFSQTHPHTAGVGYLLKDRVAHVHDFMRSLETVRSGGIVVDPAVISSLMQHRQDRLVPLTDREREILALVSEGATNHQIARTVHLSEGAVVKHISAVFDKLGISDREGNRRVLAVLAYLRGR